MISQDRRTAIYQLHLQGVPIRTIAKQLKVSRNSVKGIIHAKGLDTQKVRSDKIQLDEDLIRKIYQECDGWIQRMHEILLERENISIGYSTLTDKVRELGLGKAPQKRCDRIPDQPGEEMQHDTTLYKINVGGTKIQVIASLLYFRYSKVRYLKFYRRFNRFRMKCFFHEALTYFKYCAEICIIDNTNLARLSGSGKNAVISPEMESFSDHYGFTFKCHALNHPNRKAGNERGFYTTESNFLPGRTFQSMEDLNQQAIEWATVRIFQRKVGKALILPAKAFEFEKSFLKALPLYVPAPHQDHHRKIDQYGFATFKTNHYWIPGSSRKDVIILEYDQHIDIYHKRELLAKYSLPPEGVKRRVFSNGQSTKPKYRPKNSKRPTEPEEKKLRGISPKVDEWLTRTLKVKSVQKHSLIRSLYRLLIKMGNPLFLATIERAIEYGITDLKNLESISAHLLKNEPYQMPDPELTEDLWNRESYQDGYSCDEADLSEYDKLL